jgi:hypothetical protein
VRRNVNHGTAEVIEKWFRSHPDFGKDAAPPAASVASTESAPSVADEIQKLGRLREEGMLTEEEFVAAKRRLIGG